MEDISHWVDFVDKCSCVLTWTGLSTQISGLWVAQTPSLDTPSLIQHLSTPTQSSPAAPLLHPCAGTQVLWQGAPIQRVEYLNDACTLARIFTSDGQCHILEGGAEDPPHRWQLPTCRGRCPTTTLASQLRLLDARVQLRAHRPHLPEGDDKRRVVWIRHCYSCSNYADITLPQTRDPQRREELIRAIVGGPSCITEGIDRTTLTASWLKQWFIREGITRVQVGSSALDRAIQTADVLRQGLGVDTSITLFPHISETLDPRFDVEVGVREGQDTQNVPWTQMETRELPASQFLGEGDHLRFLMRSWDQLWSGDDVNVILHMGCSRESRF